MSQRITIEIKNKIATCLTELPVVCGNADYEVEFAFDEEWNEHEIKTATFVVNGELELKVFSGNVCEMPVLQNTLIARIGVFAGTIDDGTLSTSTPAIVHCKPCATCGNATPAPPTNDVYNQIIKRINEIELPEGFATEEYVDEKIANSLEVPKVSAPICTWDGNTEGRDTFEASAEGISYVIPFVKMNDTIFTLEEAEANFSKMFFSSAAGVVEEAPSSGIRIFNKVNPSSTQLDAYVFIVFVDVGYVCIIDAEKASIDFKTTIPSTGLYVMDVASIGMQGYISSLEFLIDCFKITEEGEVLVKGQRVATEEDLKESGQVDLEDYYNKEQIDNLVGDINSVLENILGV